MHGMTLMSPNFILPFSLHLHRAHSHALRGLQAQPHRSDEGGEAVGAADATSAGGQRTSRVAALSLLPSLQMQLHGAGCCRAIVLMQPFSLRQGEPRRPRARRQAEAVRRRQRQHAAPQLAPAAALNGAVWLAHTAAGLRGQALGSPDALCHMLQVRNK
jgi:hypothetical protein